MENVTVKISEETYKKIKKLSEKEYRTIKGIIELSIDLYERTNYEKQNQVS